MQYSCGPILLYQHVTDDCLAILSSNAHVSGSWGFTEARVFITGLQDRRKIVWRIISGLQGRINKTLQKYQCSAYILTYFLWDQIESISATGEHGRKLKSFKTQKEIASSHLQELVCQQHDWRRECFTLTAKVDGQQTDTFLCHPSTQQILNSIFPWHCLHWWRLFCHLGMKFLCPGAK